MKRKEVLERLCLLAYRVKDERYENKIPFDCICGSQKGRVADLDFHPEILAFIENAVYNEIKKGKRT